MAQTVRLIKKYPNRRLYDTESSSYVTLAEIRQLVLDHVEFQVVDAKTQHDLTRNILMQIILEEECGGAPLFSNPMLSQMIRSYGNALQGVMGNCLEQGVQSFLEIQRKLQEQAVAMMNGGGASPGAFDAEAWNRFLSMQGPALQGLMSTYLTQSAAMLIEMQKQMQHPNAFFGGFPFPFGAPSQKPREAKSKESKKEPPEK